MQRSILVAAVVAIGISGLPRASVLRAQAPADAPSFEVASVKPNKANDGLVLIGVQGDRFTANGASLRMLIQQAYQIQTDQLVGGPGWLNSERFDIVAKVGTHTPDQAAGPPAGAAQVQLMIRTLLADRFKLTMHTETRNEPVYALVMTRSDGRLGPQLHKVEVDCAAIEAQARRGGENPPAAGPATVQRRGCGTSVGPGAIIAFGQTMAQLATAMSRLSNTGASLNRPVIDRTALSGTFDADLRFTPDQVPQRPAGAPDQPFQVNGVAIDPNGPSLFTALQEQLGLKLEPTKGPVEVLVIDRAERPTED